MSDGYPAPGWVADRFGVALRPAGPDDDLNAWVQLALRRNPRRAHLLVSTVLGKHIPADPHTVQRIGRQLGHHVGRVLDGAAPLVIGYAETATALGHCVAQALRAPYLHSTRRTVPSIAAVLPFDEPHSHAVGHQLLPERPALLYETDVVVLVDDELSTGTTALNTVRALQSLRRRRRYVVAVLVDLRGPLDRDSFAATAAALDTVIEVVALATGSFTAPDGFAAAAGRVAAVLAGADGAGARRAAAPGELVEVPSAWPTDVAEGARHAMTIEQTDAMPAAADAQAAVIEPAGRDVLVLGTEELMYAPLLIAAALARQRPGVRVRFSSTTRSPVVVVDEPGYPVRSALRFTALDEPEIEPEPDPEQARRGSERASERYAYNVGRRSDIVLVVDAGCDGATLDALVHQLRGCAERVHLVVLPTRVPGTPSALHGPAFGSYAPDEVSWLLTDLSGVALEAPIEQREQAIQAGRAHYAESLPIEYQPSAQYQALFTEALAASAARLAHAVGVVTELVLDLRGPGVVLVSLARAGTPVGVLMRRWARYAHGLDLDHCTVSIVRGRGIDPVALRRLAIDHDPSAVMFVDGWTGKGAIARELAQAVAACDPRFDAELAVLADTGSCVSLFGTREDFLIPSACLNSTVSGLVSRTVLNDRLLRPGQFHGAKFYRELEPADVSALFLDAISDQFAGVGDAVLSDWPVVRDSDRRPTWAGWREVERIGAVYGIADVNLVKPGVGETTRVLLRRVPWRVLVRPEAVADLGHVLLLAEQRGVPIETVDDLGYSCVGLIRPGP